MTSQPRAVRSQSQKILKFVKLGLLMFLNCESTCDLTDVQASLYDRKIDVRSFDTTHDILRWLSLVQSLLIGRNAPILGKRELMHMKLSGTDWLRRSYDIRLVSDLQKLFSLQSTKYIELGLP